MKKIIIAFIVIAVITGTESCKKKKAFITLKNYYLCVMKTITIGDTHGRSKWKNIVEKEKDADKIIFIGDYFDAKDGYSGNPLPRYVEVNFNQACNLKCAYCSPHLSTEWQKEAEKSLKKEHLG